MESWLHPTGYVVTRGVASSPQGDTGLSPAEAVFGAQIVLPNEFLQNDQLSVDAIIKNLSCTFIA